MAYISRIADSELQKRLSAAGAVLIEGAKACGKTETARQVARSEVLLDVDKAARDAAELNPGLVLEGDIPRLIDEWQLEPEIWNHVRRAVDERVDPGQFILAGSTQPTDNETRHTGAGRISRLRMRPMSLYELGTSNGKISLAALLDRQGDEASNPGLELEDSGDGDLPWWMACLPRAGAFRCPEAGSRLPQRDTPRCPTAWPTSPNRESDATHSEPRPQCCYPSHGTNPGCRR